MNRVIEKMKNIEKGILADIAKDVAAKLKSLCNNIKVESCEYNASKNDAKNRLKLVLMHDRSRMSPQLLTKMRDELVEVISKYVEIDTDAMDLNFENDTNSIALVANIPVLRSKA